jgi:hypothetical protein
LSQYQVGTRSLRADGADSIWRRKLFGEVPGTEVSKMLSIIGERYNGLGYAARVRNDYQPVRDIGWLRLFMLRRKNTV